MDELKETITIDRLELEEKTIPVICSRCDTIFQLPRWLVAEGKRVGPSHGLCPQCHDDLLIEHESFLKDQDPSSSPTTTKRWPRFVQPFLNLTKKSDD